MFKAYKRYFDFEGRSNRSEYWLFVLLCWLAAIPYLWVVFRTQMFQAPFGALDLTLVGLYIIFNLASLIPSLSVSVRRLHDIDKSGWFLLLSLIPLIGPVVLLVFTLLPGTKGPNKFGPDPLRNDAEVFA